MPMDLPPQAVQRPAYVAPAPECRYLSDDEAQVAFSRLKASLKSTSFESARPSEICGMVMVRMASGKVVYTDPTGRFLMLAFALDTHRGSPADNNEEIERAIESRDSYPTDKPIPGLIPPETLNPSVNRMSPIATP